MSTITLRDSQQRVIGYIETNSSGVQVGRNAQQSRVGTYDPHTDKTHDAMSRLVSHGNTLAVLIHNG
jgi:hypothetical protein